MDFWFNAEFYCKYDKEQLKICVDEYSLQGRKRKEYDEFVKTIPVDDSGAYRCNVISSTNIDFIQFAAKNLTHSFVRDGGMFVLTTDSVAEIAEVLSKKDNYSSK